MNPSIEALESRIAPASIALGTGTTPSGDVTIDDLSATLNAVAGSGQLVVTGAVAIASAALTLDVSQVPADLDDFTLIENDDTDAISGTFAGLPEGGVFKADGTYFKITYEGGDGNDVVLTALVPKVTISANGKTATFADVDGDLVTLKTTVGSWASATFDLVPRGDFVGGAQLAALTLDATFNGANITVTAKRDLFGGNGFVNVGFLDAGGTDLGVVSVRGDVGRVDAGAVKALTVQSFGQLGGGASDFTGRIGKLAVKGDVRDVQLAGAGFGTISVGGSFIESTIASATDIGAITIKHDLAGTAGTHAIISAFGQAIEPAKGLDVAIKSLTVGGRVEWAEIIAGAIGTLRNADASIGAVKVGGDWVASSLTAGAMAGVDGFIGTGDDASYDDGGGTLTLRDNATRDAQLASVAIGGQVIGTSGSTTDQFGIVAEFIKKFAIGGLKLPLSPTTRDDFLAVAPTGPGGTGLQSDVFLIEVLA